MKKNKLKMLAIALFTIAAVNVMNAQGVTNPANCVPPPVGQYAGPVLGSYNGGAGAYDATNPVISSFTNCDPLPLAGSGGTTVHSYGCTVMCTITHNGLTMQITAPGQCTQRVTDTGPDGTGAETYQTEMLQLDIQGGTLPPGVMIRESPTLQSTGQIKSKPVAGGYHIDSFFDIFTELSTDAGQTWMPSTSGPGHVTLQPIGSTGIPTLSQWGLIIFSLLMLAVAMVFVYKRKSQLAAQ